MTTIHPSHKALRAILQNLTVALFKTDIKSNLWLPNNIVNVIHSDVEGHVYFYITCKKNRLAFVEKTIHCTLEFNQKDYSSSLKLSGLAEIVEHDSSRNSIGDNCQVLIKMNVQLATYSSEKISVFNTIRDKFSTFRSNLFATEKYNEVSFNF